MSVFLVVLLVHAVADPAWISVSHAAWLFVEEMVGGALLGLSGGWLLARALRRLPLDGPLAGVLALTGALALFGFAQLLGTSGFLAIYLAGIVTRAGQLPRRRDVLRFSEGMAWLAQIVLFLMLGLLVTPHDLPRYAVSGIAAALVLIFVARPVAVFACLLPFRFTLRETAFASWIGLRGAVPIYLSFLPALADPQRDTAFLPASSCWSSRLWSCRAGPSRRGPAAWVRASGMVGRAGSREGRFRPLSIAGKGSRLRCGNRLSGAASMRRQDGIRRPSSPALARAP